MSESREQNSADEVITINNVEEEIKKLKIIDDYDSDEYEHDRVCLKGAKIDLKALAAGQDCEFEINEKEDYLDEESEPEIDYEKLLKYRNFEMLCGEDDKADPTSSAESKMPFEILKLKMEDISPNKDEGVIKRVLTPGYGPLIQAGAHVKVHYNAYFEMNDEPFDSTFLRNKLCEFKLGAGEVVRGLDVAVASMKKKEKSQFIFLPEYYCGKMGCEPRVPRETSVLFEIEVVSVLELSVLDEFQYSCHEEREKIPFKKILQICNCLRELGNDSFSRQSFNDASMHYRKAIYLMENKSAQNEEEDKKLNGILLKLYLNMSQIALKQVKPKKSIYYCKLALNIENNNTKANFRYGQALRLLQDFSRSKQFLLKALRNEPTNRDIVKEIQKLEEMVKKYNMLETDMYKKMFAKKESKHVSAKKGSREEASDTKITNIFDAQNDGNNNKENVMVNKDNQLNTQTKEFITNKLREFIENPTLKVHTIQPDMYPKQMINYIEEQAKILCLEIRKINGNWAHNVNLEISDNKNPT